MKPWASTLAQALTGEHLDLPTSEQSDVAGILAGLADHGWPADRIRELAAQRRRDEQPWPFPTDSATLRELGAAAYLATLRHCQELIGADATSRAVAADRALNADERRLMEQVPPHFGHQG